MTSTKSPLIKADLVVCSVFCVSWWGAWMADWLT